MDISRPVQPQDQQVSLVTWSSGSLPRDWICCCTWSVLNDCTTRVLNRTAEEMLVMVVSGLFRGVGQLLLVSVFWVTHNVNTQ